MLFRSSNISSMGLLSGGEHPEVLAAACGDEFTSMFAHAFEASAVPLEAAAVRAIVYGTSFAKVLPAIIEGVAVPVIDESNGVLAGHHFPNQLMSGIRLSVEVYADTSEVFVARDATSASHASTNLPAQDAGLRVVVESFTESSSGREHSGYSSGWLGGVNA